MAREMTHDEIRAFLLAGTRTAKVATVRADGRPHVAPVWFVLVKRWNAVNTPDPLLSRSRSTTNPSANKRADG